MKGDFIYSKLLDNLTSHGYSAAGLSTFDAEHKNYASIFTRDIGVSALGMLASNSPEIIEGLRLSLESLILTQSPLGQLPFSFKPEKGEVRWRFEAGSLDSTIWWCIGFLLYYQYVGDEVFFRKYKPNLLKACLWLRYQDRNQDNLIEQGEAADWADEMPRRGTVLYTNALYYWLINLRLTSCSEEKALYQKLKEKLYEAFNTIFWIHKTSSYNLDYLPHNNFTKKFKKDLSILERINAEIVDLPYYIGYISHKSYESRMDVMGNLIAIYTGLADTTKSNRILEYILSAGINSPFPVKVLYPIIEVGANDWVDYMFKGGQNIPHHYHNGAIWPKATGFWIAVIKTYKPSILLQEFGKFTDLVSQEDYGFHEYYHGVYGTPMGARNQTWSITMYLWARTLIKNV